MAGGPRGASSGAKGLLSSLPSMPSIINSPRLAKLPASAAVPPSKKVAPLFKPAPPTTKAPAARKSLQGDKAAHSNTAAAATAVGVKSANAAPRRVSVTSNPQHLPARPRVGQSVISAADMAKGEDVLTYMCSRLDALLQEEDEFDTQFAAATRIQCLCRRFRAVSTANQRRAARLQLQSAQSRIEEMSASCIKRFLFRLVLLRRRESRRVQAELLRKQKEHGAATVIQRRASIWLARSEARRRRNFEKNHSKAVRVLQCWFRQSIARRRVARMRRVLSKLSATALLQQKREVAAVNIQRVWRTVLSSQVTVAARGARYAENEREVLSRRVTMAVNIQRIWRGFVGRRFAWQQQAKREAREAHVRLADRERIATTCLQALCRGIIARREVRPTIRARRQEAEVQQQASHQRAAIKIQTAVRRALARMWFARLAGAKQRVLHRERYLFVAGLLQRVGRGCSDRAMVSQLLFQRQFGEHLTLCAKESAIRRLIGEEECSSRCGASIRTAYTELKQGLAALTARRMREASERQMAETRRRLEDERAAEKARIETEICRRQLEAQRKEDEEKAKIAWENERRRDLADAFTKSKVGEAVDILGSIMDSFSAAKEELLFDSMAAVKELPIPPAEETMTAEEEADAERLLAKHNLGGQPQALQFNGIPKASGTAPLSDFSLKLASAAAAKKVATKAQQDTAAAQIQRIARGIAVRQHFKALQVLRSEYLEARVDSERTVDDARAPAPPKNTEGRGRVFNRCIIPDKVSSTLAPSGVYVQLDHVMDAVVGYAAARSAKSSRGAAALEAYILGKHAELAVSRKVEAKRALAAENLAGMVKIIEAKHVRECKRKEARNHKATIEAEQRNSVLAACILAQLSVRYVRYTALSRIEGGVRIVKAKRLLASKRRESESQRQAMQALDNEVFAIQNGAAATIQRSIRAIQAAKLEVAQRRQQAQRARSPAGCSTSSHRLEAELAAGLIQRSFRASKARLEVQQRREQLSPPRQRVDPDDSTTSQQLEENAAASLIQRAFRSSRSRQQASDRRKLAARRRQEIRDRDIAEDAAARTIQGAHRIFAAKERRQQLRAATAEKWEERRRQAANEDERDDEHRFNLMAGEYETVAAAADVDYEF